MNISFRQSHWQAHNTTTEGTDEVGNIIWAAALILGSLAPCGTVMAGSIGLSRSASGQFFLVVFCYGSLF
jgi:hypothetical protein